MDPAKETELLLQIPLLERHNKPDKANGVEREADDAMVGSKRHQLRVCEHDMLKRTVN